jgi:hypothetical protein
MEKATAVRKKFLTAFYASDRREDRRIDGKPSAWVWFSPFDLESY